MNIFNKLKRKQNWKKWIDSQVAVVPFIVFLEERLDYMNKKQSKEIIKLIQKWRK